MSSAIVMPQLGLTMTEGSVSEWLKKPGDLVKKNEAVFIVSTDKVEMEVESAVAGTLVQILVQPGETVPVGTVVAYIDSTEVDEETVGGSSPTILEVEAASPVVDFAPSVLTSVPDAARATIKSSGERRVSPRAKRLASELGVNLDQITGSGESGQIVEEDVRRASSTHAPKTPSSDIRRRKLIAERLTKSIQTIPAFTVSAEANAEKLLALRKALLGSIKSGDAKLTITDLLFTIFATVLKASPGINSIWEKDNTTPHTSVDIGLAVATPQGVVAPVIRKANELALPALIERRHELVDKGRRSKLSLTDLEGGVTTLSNLGMYRVDQFQAIIAPGQSSILAVGSIRNRPWVDTTSAQTTLVVKPTVILNFTVDHRVVDGDQAATFLNKLIELIEDPSGHVWQPRSESRDGASRGLNA